MDATIRKGIHLSKVRDMILTITSVPEKAEHFVSQSIRQRTVVPTKGVELSKCRIGHATELLAERSLGA